MPKPPPSILKKNWSVSFPQINFFLGRNTVERAINNKYPSGINAAVQQLVQNHSQITQSCFYEHFKDIANAEWSSHLFGCMKISEVTGSHSHRSQKSCSFSRRLDRHIYIFFFYGDC